MVVVVVVVVVVGVGGCGGGVDDDRFVLFCLMLGCSWSSWVTRTGRSSRNAGKKNN